MFLVGVPPDPSDEPFNYDVVKFSPLEWAREEYEAFEKYVRPRFGVHVPLVQDHVLDQSSRLGVVLYTRVAGRDVGPLDGFIRDARGHSEIYPVLENLFKRKEGEDNPGSRWYTFNKKVRRTWAFEYNRYFPPSLTVELSSSRSTGHQPVKDAACDTFDEIAGQAVDLGELRVTEEISDRRFRAVDQLTKTKVDLVLPEDSSGSQFAQKPTIGTTVRVAGKIADTRMGILFRAAREAFVQEGVTADDLKNERFRLHEGTFPNPLFYYPRLLGEPSQMTTSVIHGDLNLTNVLVDGNQWPWVIDFASAREGHTAIDFARLEVEIRTRILAKEVTLASFIAFENRLWDAKKMKGDADGFYKGSPTLPFGGAEKRAELRKAFAAIYRIRQLASQFVSWKEYATSVFFFSLSCLKFKNLSTETAGHPRPWQFAFLTAAFALRELVEHPAKEEARTPLVRTLPKVGYAILLMLALGGVAWAAGRDSLPLLSGYSVGIPFVSLLGVTLSMFRKSAGGPSAEISARGPGGPVSLSFVFLSLVVFLNIPLLATLVMGVDPYGLYVMMPLLSLSHRVVASVMINIVVSTLAISLLSFLWRRSKDLSATVTRKVAVPVLGFAIVAFVPLLLMIDMTNYFYSICVAVLYTVGVLAILGYSHPENKLDHFLARMLLSVGVGIIVIGWVLVTVIMLVTWGQPVETPTHHRAILFERPIPWESLQPMAGTYSDAWRAGYATTVFSHLSYLSLFVGLVALLMIYRHQYLPARRAIEDGRTPA